MRLTGKFAKPNGLLKPGAFLALLIAAPLSAKDTYCFENAGLKAKDVVRFSVYANRISAGTYTRTPYEDESQARVTKFTGTKTGTVLTISLKGKPVYEKAKGEDIIIWSLRKNKLSIPMHGKNHETGRYTNYDATFEKCAP